MDRHDDSLPDYEQLRRHVQRPRPEHPAGRQQPRAPVPELPTGEARLSVMNWLVEIGQAVARKLRRAPRSAMVRVHPRD